MTAATLDLGGCAAEPIRVPGAIQPHGWLLVHDVQSGQLVAYSENCRELARGLDASAEPILLTHALQAIVDRLRAMVPADSAEGPPVSLGRAVIGDRSFDVTSALAGKLALLELELASTDNGTRAPMYALARRVVPLLQQTRDVEEVAELAAREMKRLTGFGRCLVYSFDSAGHGNVLAESADPEYESYLGHSFPATDIPTQARELYVLNHIRLIPDAGYRPSKLHFVDPAWNVATLDLSFAQLRSVSPVHLDYMRNMATPASMSVSIVVRGALWGLISCHDHAPHGLDLETRFACEHLGRLVSLQIEAKENSAEVETRHRLRRMNMEIVASLGESEGTLEGLVDSPELLLGVARSDGAAVVFDDQCWHVGMTPSDAHTVALADWIAGLGVEVYDCDNLAATDAPFALELANTAGLMAISLSRVHRHMIMWFRPEFPRSVRWAGAPSKREGENGRLHPRRSFNTWEEILRGRCPPWTVGEVSTATELRQSLIGMVLDRAQERAAAAGRLGRVTLAKELAEQASSAKTHFLAVVSHELRGPLGSIANAAELLSCQIGIPESTARLIDMIKRNVAIEARLIGDLLDLSAVAAGKLNLTLRPIHLAVLVGEVVALLRHEILAKDLHVSIDAGDMKALVMADPIRMQQVFWNVVRNAVKFTPHGGHIDIVCSVRGDESVVTCADSGVGIDAEALSRIFLAYEQVGANPQQRTGGLGLGLAIAMGIVQGHGGTMEAASDGRDRGTVVTVRLPLTSTWPDAASPKTPPSNTGPAV